MRWQLILNHPCINHCTFRPRLQLLQFLVPARIRKHAIPQIRPKPVTALDHHLQQDPDVSRNSLMERPKVLRTATDRPNIDARVKRDDVHLFDCLLGEG